MIRYFAALMLTVCFTLAVVLEPVFERIRPANDASSNMLIALMGDSRRLFAAHFFAEADAYFHSGFYPTIFDTAKPENPKHLKEEAHEKPGQKR